MKTVFKLIALGALAGMVITGISAAATESSDVTQDSKINYDDIVFALPNEVLDKMEALTYESSDGTSLPYRIYYSPAYDAEDKDAPAMLFVFLHGSGGRGNDNIRQISDQVATVNYMLSESGEAAFADIPYVVIAPQCAEGAQWVESPWAQGSYGTDEVAISAQLNAVYELILKTLKNDNIDPANVILGGISMGGYGTWDLAVRHPELFNAIFPICGSGDPTKAEAIKDLKIWTFHSDNDASVPVQGTRDMVAALKKIGADVKYTEFTGKGHNAWRPAMDEVKDPYLLEWLFEDCRKYRISVLTTEGDELSESIENLRYGDEFTVEFDPADGFMPESLFVNGEEAEFITDDSGKIYYQCVVKGDMDINAVFAKAEESAPESTDSKDNESAEVTKGLSKNAKIGIAAGAAAITAAIIGGIVAGKKKKKQ